MKRWLIYLAAGLTALLLGVILNVLTQKSGPATLSPENNILKHGTALTGQERPLPKFSLIDKNGQPFGNDQLKGKWSFLFFGYTHCPDICPVTLQVMGQTLKNLENAGAADQVQAMFISVDPDRDTPEHLKTYAEYFHPNMLAATGTKEALDRLTRPLGIISARIENEKNPEQYLVDHSAQILVINPEGKFAAVFGAPHEAKIIAEELQILMQHG